MFVYSRKTIAAHQKYFDDYQREKSTEKTLEALLSNLALFERRYHEHNGGYFASPLSPLPPLPPLITLWEGDKRAMLEEALAEGIITRELFESLSYKFSVMRE